MTDEVYVMQKNYLRFGSNPLSALMLYPMHLIELT